jgi:hypothetical protein
MHIPLSPFGVELKLGRTLEALILTSSHHSSPPKAIAKSLPSLPATKATVAVRGGNKRPASVATAGERRRISLALPIFAAWLYNLSIGFTIPVMPKVRQ